MLYAYGGDTFTWNDGRFSRGRPAYIEKKWEYELYYFSVNVHHRTRDALLRAGLIEEMPFWAQENLGFTAGNYRLTQQGVACARTAHKNISHEDQEKFPVAVAFRNWLAERNR
jgi:hypothetical protein